MINSGLMRSSADRVTHNINPEVLLSILACCSDALFSSGKANSPLMLLKALAISSRVMSLSGSSPGRCSFPRNYVRVRVHHTVSQPSSFSKNRPHVSSFEVKKRQWSQITKLSYLTQIQEAEGAVRPLEASPSLKC